MQLLGKRSISTKFPNIGYKFFCEQYASLSSWQYTETRSLMASATMGEQPFEKPPDLSTWSADQLITRVISLEQQLKEQTAKCV